MTTVETVSISAGGDVPIPTAIQQAAGITAGSRVVLEASNGTILIRPISDDFEVYTAERRAEFLLNNAVDRADYEAACMAVRQLGLDPEKILHDRPASPVQMGGKRRILRDPEKMPHDQPARE